MTILLVIGYILIGCASGAAIYVFAYEPELGIMVGLLWPILVPIAIIVGIIAGISWCFIQIFRYLFEEGIHYYVGDLEKCCGQCLYCKYHNSHNELNTCKHMDGGTSLSSKAIPCERFIKHPLWRFRIRIGKRWNK